MALFALSVLTGTSGCAAKPVAAEFARKTSTAIPQDTPSTLQAALKGDIAAHPGKSGFRLITEGTEAFSSRIALIREADKTLDLQYYIVEDDLTGKLLLEEILEAAERGVRIRLLVDQLSVSKVDNKVALLDSIPNVEIRSFNPIVTRRQPVFAALWKWVGDFDEAGSRMHNKAMIIDNQVAIVGGRNLGDEYFDYSSDFNFADMDVQAVGPIVAEVSRQFDTYWNSNHAYPLEAVTYQKPTPEELENARMELKAHRTKIEQEETGQRIREEAARWTKETEEGRMAWADAELHYDLPEKVDEEKSEVTIEHSRPMMALAALLEKAETDFHAISPYFVPRDEGVERLAALEKRGVQVRVLTNSLVSTDVPAVHAGYRRYRDELLEHGVELYEAKIKEGKRTRQNLAGSTPRSSLHAKVYVVDRKELVVASFNLDPRSASRNTELGLTIHSPQLAAQALKMFDDATSPAKAYSLSLDEDGDPVWTTEEDGKTVQYTRDPEAGLWRRTQVFVFSHLPVEHNL